jgi:hypothetical protein
MTDYATRLFNDSDTSQRMRLSDALHAMPGGSLRSRGGLRTDGGGVPALVPSTLKFTLTPFIAEVPGSAATQGAYPFVHDDGSTQYDILPGDPLGARIDLVVVRVRHNAFDSSGFTDAGIVVIKGSPTTGIVPTVPAGCIPIREFNVSATASAGSGGVTIGTDRRRTTVSTGGVLPVSTTADRTALSTAGLAYRGLVVDNAQANRLERYDGTAWRPVQDDLDVCLGLFWGAGFDASVHDHKTLSYAAAATSSAGANVTVIDLATQFVGVSGVTATTTNGNAGSGGGTPRHLSAFVSGSTLYLRCEDASGAPVVSGAVQFSVIVHGWV